MSKNKSRIRVTFGHNSENVTGSYTLIECGQSGKKILVDFGLIQENLSMLKEYQINSKRPSFKEKELTYIFATHSHIDHIGRMSLLPKHGCTAPIIVPEGSKAIFKEMCLDSANILERNALDLSKKFQKDYQPIYTKEDVYRALEYIKEYSVGKKIQLDEDIAFKMTYNSHIFKAVSITFWIKNGAQTRKIVVTGDIGNLAIPQKFTEKFEPFENCNLLVGECTYADSKRSATMKDREKDLEKLKTAIITTCQDRKGKVLIPTFAFGRSPTMLATLYDLFYEDSQNGLFDIPIIYASPLGTKLLNIFQEELEEEQGEYLRKVLSWKNIKVFNNFEQLEAEVKDEKPKIFCVPSGMMSAGYSVYVASELLPRSNNCIIFCGYSAEGTLSWKIKQKKTKTISIDGKAIHSRCQVTNLVSFSSHIQHQELIDLYSGKNGAVYDKVALVHSNYKDKVAFAKEIQEESEKRGNTTKIICVNKSTEISL